MKVVNTLGREAEKPLKELSQLNGIEKRTKVQLPLLLFDIGQAHSPESRNPDEWESAMQAVEHLFSIGDFDFWCHHKGATTFMIAVCAVGRSRSEHLHFRYAHVDNRLFKTTPGYA